MKYVFDGPNMGRGQTVYLSDPAIGGERACYHPERSLSPGEIIHHNPLREIDGALVEQFGPEGKWYLDGLIERGVVTIHDRKPAKPAKE